VDETRLYRYPLWLRNHDVRLDSLSWSAAGDPVAGLPSAISCSTAAALLNCLVIVTLFAEEFFATNLKWLAG
jgi:hypothetical protein